VSSFDESVQIVEVDNADGLAKILREFRKLYPLVKDDPEILSKLKYAIDLGNNCLFQHWQTQQVRLMLSRDFFSGNIDIPDPEDDPSTKH
jgi:hypothetical protein